MKSWLLAKIKQSYLFTINRFAKKNKKQHQQIVYLLSFPSTSNYIIEKLFQKYQKRLTICYTKNATNLARTYQEKGCQIYCIDSQLILFRHIVPLLKSARVILCDNYFAILGGIDFLPKTKIVQLWHANGAIKKFGLEAHYAKKATQIDQKRYKDVYRRYTHYVVSSPKMALIFERSYQRELTFLPFGYPPTDQYFKRDDEKIKEVEANLKDKNVNPRDIKMDLAREILSLYHTEEEVEQAEERFKMIFQMGQKPKDMDTVNVSKEDFDLISTVVDKGLVSSKSEFRRLLLQGGIKINDKKITMEKDLPKEGEIVVQVGKKKFMKIIVS